MPVDAKRLDYLLEAYIKERCSEAERLELLRLIHDGRDQDMIREWMDQSRRRFMASYELNEQSADQIFNNILQAVPAAVVPIKPTSKRTPVSLVWWAAAAILIAVGFGSLWLLHPFSAAPPVAPAAVAHNDVAPGATRAMLTLADGQKIAIDTAANGKLAVQGRTTIVKTNGSLSYEGRHAPSVLYNTLTTGRGEQSPSLTLSDGTKVWLDAASSIRFPVVFTGKQRVVEITGQPYFEVAKNAAMP
ncbi:MAG TPA: FecR domain-containing protein, partial [Chitinophagaceae bacterium]|nr:FecR domain-containing protein [Chitinophagaceae bacterium]